MPAWSSVLGFKHTERTVIIVIRRYPWLLVRIYYGECPLLRLHISVYCNSSRHWRHVHLLHLIRAVPSNPSCRAYVMVSGCRDIP